MGTVDLKPSKVDRPFGIVINGLAIAAFIISLYCCATPGLQILTDTTLSGILFAPGNFLLSVHLGLMSWMGLWVIVFWGWVICLLHYWRTRNRRWQWMQWWIAPLLLWLISLLWVTHVPIALNFSVHRSVLEQLGNTVSQQSQNWVDLNQKIGSFQVIGGSKLMNAEGFTGKIAIAIEGIGAYQGFIRDNSCKASALAPNTYSFAPGSNNGDQSIYPLWDGWYIFQNYFD